MTNLIALEAASNSCSVTLNAFSISKTMVVEEARSHSKHFLPLIQALLDECQVKLADFDFIACGNGPGSFTGLRICFGIAQGLAFGLNVPLLTVSSLESMAFSFYGRRSNAQVKVVCLLDAHMGELYCGRFCLRDGVVMVEGEPQLLSLTAATEMISELSHRGGDHFGLVGPGIKLLTLSDECKSHFVINDQIEPISSAVAEIALRQWRDGRLVNAEEAEIRYLRNSVSWDKRKRIRVDAPKDL